MKRKHPFISWIIVGTLYICDIEKKFDSWTEAFTELPFQSDQTKAKGRVFAYHYYYYFNECDDDGGDGIWVD